uniref:Uncharacterized protein n=1 Tax=Anolis carolinensis TaxID=28377 RepID=A0A803TVF5_ANOCA
MTIKLYSEIISLNDPSGDRLCDYVCDLLLEESNVQPVSTPVTVCGDIHGQVRFLTHLHIVENLMVFSSSIQQFWLSKQ